MLDKTFDPKAVETRQSERWDSAEIGKPAGNGAPFTVMMPPPNVTGSLHVGHALNHTLQDVIVRYRRMKKDRVLWQPGTDHAGIATQMIVERQLAAEGKSRRDFTRDEFIERIWKWKAESGGAIVNQLHRLGTSPDWSRERFTMDEGLSDAVRKVFVRLYKQGLIYRDKRLVNWDPKLHTAISDLEVEAKPHKGSLWHLRYAIAGEPDRVLVVATTRPETMLGDTAVAVNPEDERYKDLIGKHAILQLVGRLLPIVGDEHADPETGSGAVKITPAHDFNDFEVARRHGLELINVFDSNAHLNDNVPERFQGMERYAARKAILAELEELGVIEKVEPHDHTLPTGDRSGVTIEPWLTDQWYVDAATLAKPAIAAVEDGRTRFVPVQWEKTYFEWLRNIQPWCISRQLWWGHRIPAWYGPDQTIFVEETETEALAAAKAHYGHDVELVRDNDVLDTWFSSALWPFSTLGWPEQTPELTQHYPTDLLVTSFDIIFFWVARMMMMGLHFMDDVPFKRVYIHALVRDEHGQKMSKTKGNVIDPLVIIEKFGADALRFTLTALTAQGRDIRLSEQRVEGYRNFATKLWNAARFCQMNECHPVPGFDPGSVKLAVNRWAVGELALTAGKVADALDNLRFSEAALGIYQFAWGTFCDWYLEFTKPLLAAGGEGAVETRATTAWLLDQILLLLHPTMPFLTEELYEKLGDRGGHLLATSEWPEFGEALVDAAAKEEIDWLVRLISAIRSTKSDINVSAVVPLILKDAGDASIRRLNDYRGLIERMARVDTANALGEAPTGGAARIALDEMTVVLPLAGAIDFAVESARLNKELKRLEGEIDRIDKKLGNEQFVARAPEEVIAEQREKRAEYAAAADKVRGALEMLA
ncbi:MAG TPA: valine--tRNA ligase [Alphaproteobacteria bacterium]|nr:valine--tRNA ligase [Alphaproteobacteria bacterium]